MDSAVALRSRRAAMDTGPTMRSRVNSPPDYMGLALPRTCRVPVVPRARLAKAVAELRGLPGNLQGNWREKRARVLAMRGKLCAPGGHFAGA